MAMLLNVLIVNIGFTAPPPPLPEISMDPTGRIPGPGALGQPGDILSFNIYISDVVDLWACQFTIKYAPFVAVLSAQDFAAGPFLSEGMEGIDWTMNVVTSAFEGTVTFVIMRLPQWGEPRVGESGSGMLASLNFLVVEAGQSSIELTEGILLDSDVNEMPHTLGDGAFYYGTIGRLIRTNLPDGRNPRVGETFTISSKVKNEGDIPLWIQVRYEIHRFDDGRNIEIRAGQTYGGGGLGEPLPFIEVYADGYLGGGDGSWSNPGALIGPPDGNYQECTSAYGMTGWYTFPSITLAGREIQNVDLYGYTAQPDGSTSWDFDPYVYVFDPTYDDTGDVLFAGWCDSLGGTPTWAWTGGRYYQGGPYDMPEYYGNALHYEAGFNAMQVEVMNYCPSGPRQQIDSIKWIVEFASITPVIYGIYVVEPGMEMELPPVTWPVTAEQVGSYELTSTIEYSGIEIPTFRHYNSMGSRTIVSSFTVKP
jgi:hypothetical protein